MLNNRKLARDAGEVKFIGRVCDMCGGSERYTRSGCCVACQARRDLKNSGGRKNDPLAFQRPVFVLGRVPGLDKQVKN